jgi:NADPH:quinone reductase-like Zn-dependent oxidoreductase
LYRRDLCVRLGPGLWDYRGINPVEQPTPFGHEYVGVVEEVGSEVTAVKPGQFVVHHRPDLRRPVAYLSGATYIFQGNYG